MHQIGALLMLQCPACLDISDPRPTVNKRNGEQDSCSEACAMADRKLTAEERVWTIASSLHSNFTRKRWDRISIRQLINRLLLLFQRPVIFVIYRSESSGWRRVFHSHRDYAYQKRFHNEIIDELHTSEDKELYQPTPASPKAPQRITGTDFGIILIGVSLVKTEKPDSPDSMSIKFAPIEEGAEEYRLLASLWNAFLKSRYSESVGVPQRLSAMLEALFDNKNEARPKTAEPDDTRLTPGFLEQQIGIIQDQVTEPVYRDVEHSPLISNRGKRPRNIFFLLRYYDEVEYRKRSAHDDKAPPNLAYEYPYSIRMLLPPSQEDDIRKSFNTMRNLVAFRDREHKTWRYQYENENDGRSIRETNDEYTDSQWAEWFWRTLETDKGIDTFIHILTSPFGKGTRGLGDPTLASGFVHFRAAIFSDGGVNRILPDLRRFKKKFEKKGLEDMKRIVILHYLFGAASPTAANKENMGAMIVPLRAGSRTYMTITQVTLMKKKGKLVGEDYEHWLRNIHFFSDVGRHAVQRLRYHSKAVYLDQIKTIFVNTFKSKLEIKNNDPDKPRRVAAEDIEDEINTQCDNLCRVWPYPKVELFFEGGGAPDGDENSVSMGEGIDAYHLRFTMEEINAYYNHRTCDPIDGYTPEHGFIEIDEVKTCLKEAVGEIRRYIASSV